MRPRANIWAILLCLGILGVCGCRRNIVRAAPAAVDSPPQPSATPPQPEPSAPVATVEPQPETPQPPPEPEPLPAPATSASRPAPPARPRTAPAEAGPIKPTPEPEPPQISPALTPQQQAASLRLTNSDLVAAEKNLQAVNGKKLNASQNDLVAKVREFVNQAHEAILAKDWVGAQNLAHKAQILSVDLKSF